MAASISRTQPRLLVGVKMCCLMGQGVVVPLEECFVGAHSFANLMPLQMLLEVKFTLQQTFLQPISPIHFKTKNKRLFFC